MAQARRADRAVSQAAIYFAAALIAAIVLTVMVATGTLNIFTEESSWMAPDGANPALLQAERDWEGEVDPLVKYFQDYERQRHSGGAYDGDGTYEQSGASE